MQMADQKFIQFTLSMEVVFIGKQNAIAFAKPISESTWNNKTHYNVVRMFSIFKNKKQHLFHFVYSTNQDFTCEFWYSL